MRLSMLDTDTLSHFIRGKTPSVTFKVKDYLREHGQLTFSAITRYEVLRGLLAKRARRQIADFEYYCDLSDVLPITDEILVRAAHLHATLKRAGTPLPDADILIAATALVHGLPLVTGNTKHFGRIEGLELEDWSL
jgi:tRNA(fMet)-specific endonuclease VapC